MRASELVLVVVADSLRTLSGAIGAVASSSSVEAVEVKQRRPPQHILFVRLFVLDAFTSWQRVKEKCALLARLTHSESESKLPSHFLFAVGVAVAAVAVAATPLFIAAAAATG